MTEYIETERDKMKIIVDPGACRMVTTIFLQRNQGRMVSLGCLDSECERIQLLSNFIETVSLKEIFLPISTNPVFRAAENAKLHPSCPVPIAILKGMETVLGMAVSKGVSISFE